MIPYLFYESDIFLLLKYMVGLQVTFIIYYFKFVIIYGEEINNIMEFINNQLECVQMNNKSTFFQIKCSSFIKAVLFHFEQKAPWKLLFKFE